MTSKLMKAVHKFYEEHVGYGSELPDDSAQLPHITRFGTLSVSQQGVQIRDFSTDKPPNDGDMQKAIIDWAIGRLLEARTLFGPRPIGIERYVDAIEHSLRTYNWFGALFLSLAMPDICGALEDPSSEVGNRYRVWFDRYLGFRYVPALFSAADCYRLRCAALHEGLAEHEKMQSERIVFIVPPPGGYVVHSCFIEPEDGVSVLLLQIDVFCREICEGVRKWYGDIAARTDVTQRISKLLEFQDPTQPIRWKVD